MLDVAIEIELEDSKYSAVLKYLQTHFPGSVVLSYNPRLIDNRKQVSRSTLVVRFPNEQFVKNGYSHFKQTKLSGLIIKCTGYNKN
jgi:hypothetical protein